MRRCRRVVATCLGLALLCAIGCTTPVAAWRFDDPDNPGRDWGPDSLDGRTNGAARIAEVDARSALELDGTDGFIEVVYDIPFDLPAFRIETVFKLAPDGLGQPNNIIGKGSSDPASPLVNYALAVAPDAAVAFGFEKGPAALTPGPAVLRSMPGLIEPGVWYRVTAGFDGRRQFLSVARDLQSGVPVYEDSRPEPAGPQMNHLFPVIGAWRGPEGMTRFFHGWIDEIAVYKLPIRGLK
jgi:hypothetical protein